MMYDVNVDAHSKIYDELGTMSIRNMLDHGWVIIWDSSVEQRERNMKVHPHQPTVYFSCPYPKELTNA